MRERGSPRAAQEARSLGEAAFRGKQPSFADRAERIRALQELMYGRGGPSAPKAEGAVPPPRAHRPPELKSLSAHRIAAENAGVTFLTAVLAGDMERTKSGLQPWCVMLWPDGTLLGHESGALLEALKRRFAREAPATPIKPSVYSAGELASFLPRGMADAIHAVLGADRGFLFTAELDSPKQRLGRVLLALSLDATKTKWLAHNLPLPAIDEAYLMWRHASTSEDEAERVAERAVRQHVLGNATQIQSLRNACMDKLFLGDALIDVSEWPKKASDGLDLDRAIDTVFLEPNVSRGRLTSLLGAKHGGAIERGAKAAWNKPLEALEPKVVSVKLGLLDPKTGEVGSFSEAKAVVLKTVERDKARREIVRWRLGALSLP